MAIELKPRIVVFGVGGAGGNAVNNMIDAKLQGVDFIVANTDAQALTRSKTDKQVQLGVETTEGLGAGAQPKIGAASAEESVEEIKDHLKGAHMCFIAAGMGGGTGTGAAPIIAREAREQGVLTVGVVTKPFDFEGARRMTIAQEGVEALRENVDTLIIIPNQNLFRIANADTTFAEAFGMADRVLYSGVRGITDLMVMPGLINLDFADVRTVMAEMGAAMMGTGEGEGEHRAVKAAKAAIANPLLDDVSMKGARGVLINITGGYDMTLYEVDEAANEVRAEIDPNAQIILGSTFDENMNGRIRVSVVATGIDSPMAAKPPAAFIAQAETATPEAPSAPDAPSAPPQTVAPAAAEADEGAAEIEAPDAPTAPEPAPAHSPIITTRTSVEVEDEPQDEPAAAGKEGLSSLFGWRRPGEPGVGEIGAEAPTEIDDLEDEELEIPAFLRRSGSS